MQTIRKDFLDAFPFFQNCPASTVADIVSVMQPHSFAPEQAVFRVGDVCGVIAFLLSGQIRVYTTGASGREITLYHVEGGNELGTSREIISRVLEDFEQRGMVRLSRNQISIVRL